MKSKNLKKKSKPSEPTTQTNGAKVKALNEVDYVHREGKFGAFEVRKTANAWWGSQFGGQAKLVEYLSAVKKGLPTVRCCAYAGLTVDQVDYFIKIHPKFSEILPLLAQTINIAVSFNIAKKIDDGCVETSKWHAERVMKDTYSIRQEHTGANGRPLNPPVKMTPEERKKFAAEILATDKVPLVQSKSKKGAGDE